MSSAVELQTLYYATLTGNPYIMALVNRVYDDVPTEPFGNKNAYISFGATDSREDDADCIDGLEITSQIDIWSRDPNQLECKIITDLVRRALHRQNLSLTTNALVETRVELSRIMPSPGGLHHGVVQVTAIIEEA